MSKVTDAIILAAGRGSRMGELGTLLPKCLTRIAGRPILEWGIEALQQAGIKRVHIVSGFRGEQLRIYAAPPRVTVLHNSEWQSSDMVSSLIFAVDRIKPLQSFLVVYGDILFQRQHIERLIRCRDEIGITYDLDWRKLWQLRFAQPLCDAESFVIKSGRLVQIGCEPSTWSEIQGQYMGLLCIRGQGWSKLRGILDQIGSSEVKQLQMTELLNKAIQTGHRIEICAINGKWCEVDSNNDLATYQRQLGAKEGWSHDWRGME